MALNQEKLNLVYRFFKISYIVPLDDFLTLLLVLYGVSLLPYGIIHLFVGDASFFYIGLVFGVLIVCAHVYNLLFEFSDFQRFVIGFALSVLHLLLLIFVCISTENTDFIWIWFYPGGLIFYCIIHPSFATIFTLILFPLLYTTFSVLLEPAELFLFLSIYIILMVFAHIAGFKICSDKEKLKTLMLTDSVTGLKNRLALDRMIRNSRIPCFFREIKKIQSVIYFDIDELKKIDDIYGHSVNDIIIQRVTRLVQNTLKNTDHFYRHSGKGFILFSEKGEDIMKEAQNLKKVVQETCIFDNTQAISISFGVASKSGKDSIEDIMLQAYEELMKSKSGGTNLPESNN